MSSCLTRKTTSKHPSVGRRVQIPAYTDMWMRGARFGTIKRVTEGGDFIDPNDPRGRTIFHVQMDHPQIKRPVKVIADDCAFV